MPTERFRYDRCSKWLLQHHGDALLRLAGLTDIASWRPLPGEIVQPRQLPDGVLEVRRVNRAESDLYVVEVSTFPDNRVPEQLLHDTALVYLDRGRLPEVVVIVLRPRGNVRVEDHLELASPGGWSNWRASWRVVELWNLPAAELLAAGDPGVMPWVPLTRFDGPPEAVFAQCRAVIDDRAAPEEHESLLSVCQVLAGLRYNDAWLLALLGGKKAMFESPVLQGWMSEQMHEATLAILQDRLGPIPSDLREALFEVKEIERATQLNRPAARCPDFDTFRGELPA